MVSLLARVVCEFDSVVARGDQTRGQKGRRAQSGQERREESAGAGGPITAANVPYGTHERQVTQIFGKPTPISRHPVAFCIHGGGWRGR